ncbi:putative E3 SUMO-protein ligase Nse2 (Mms21) [Helianthus annuus]|uniref:E3 SUMO-protein ligase Nse2 (Mms21) n=1 Tax=Helianthus annuus TaxID=4232 RepID=A0A251TMH1_HELAN|nr:E3 SUMO-protein ligase MMS21 [Helianthus annuus]KAF5787177.1 putative E3 SUMO-protein ligase Nse2 (Mms21) [Helianthus annuus]KAJ0514465.1 putative E3 SUMO-protein ligase Nse2 (Mms21) [Helianthus annuus]KAJ0522651.1 putative E3 SUMO-protein ligase Nse2 (Mms21) [Helianthus annuus]KAJ0530609.1 putative E3 SUMO-protein ligase Nse2 (Mms21) [Helianthus annuus]KAJ0697467.1 putative E3 SUMO-protein ligase Nse2 (Mms21) [Helianthus annuus]
MSDNAAAMASTSTSDPRNTSKMKSAATTLSGENQTLLADIRKAMVTMKEIGVSLEKQNKTQMVKELETEFVELLKAYEECANLSTAVESVGNMYRPSEQVTDFKKLIDNEMVKTKRRSSAPQVSQLLRQFKEAIWNVHNSGLPMPGEEQEDIVMTSTQNILLNNTCPLSGKPVTELSEPVRSMDCKHIYEKSVIMQYIRSKHGQPKCPMAACPKIIKADRVVCDPLLHIEIEESRAMNQRASKPNIIEDFTGDSENEGSE